MAANTGHLLYHQCVGDLYKNGWPINEIEFISNRIYPSNSNQYRNPYFKLVQRDEGPELPDHGAYLSIYDPETREFIPQFYNFK